MDKNFDLIFNKVESISLGPVVKKTKSGYVFDIYIRESNGQSFSLRCNMIDEYTENRAIYYFGLKGAKDE